MKMSDFSLDSEDEKLTMDQSTKSSDDHPQQQGGPKSPPSGHEDESQERKTSSRSSGNRLQQQQGSSCESLQLSSISSSSSSSFISFILKWWFAVVVSSIIPAIDLCGVFSSVFNPVTRRREYGATQQNRDKNKDSNADSYDDPNLSPLIEQLESEQEFSPINIGDTNIAATDERLNPKSSLTSNGTSNRSFMTSKSFRSSTKSFRMSNKSINSSNNSGSKRSLKSSSRRSLSSSKSSSIKSANGASFRSSVDHDDEGDNATAKTMATTASLATNITGGNMDEYRMRLSEMYLRSEGRFHPSNINHGEDNKVEKPDKETKKDMYKIDEKDDEAKESASLDLKQSSVHPESQGLVSGERLSETQPTKDSRPSYNKEQSEKSSVVNLESIDLDAISEEHMSQLSDDGHNGVRLRGEAYTFLMIKEPLHISWLVGIATFILQIVMLSLFLTSRLAPSSDSTIFHIPFNVTGSVRGSQFFLMFIAMLLSSHDLFRPIRELKMLCLKNKSEWSRVVSKVNQSDDEDNKDEDEEEPLVILITDVSDTANCDEDNDDDNSTPDQPTVHHENDKNIWLRHIVVPNLLRFILAIFTTLIMFLIIIQTKTIMDLILHVIAIQAITRLNYIVFYLTKYGYLGRKLKSFAILAKQIKLSDSTSTKCFTVPLRCIIFLTLFTTTICVFGPIISGQQNGSILRTKYPNCQVNEPDKISKIADGICHGGIQNTVQCGFDGGDCNAFNAAYPNCKTENAWQIGDGHCQEEHNTVECGFDGHDCCPIKDIDQYLGDGKCHGGFYFSNACKYDKGDCDELRKRFPFCPELLTKPKRTYNGGPVVLGNGVCDFIPEYMTEECGYEYGDCMNCQVKDPKDIAKLGDGVCNGGILNTAECGWDGGDCIECNVRVDDFSKIGDGICDGGKYLTEACNFDGLDCENCQVEDPTLIGNGVCDHGKYNTMQCGWDGEDCQCFNNASNGFCEDNPSKMLHCREACGIRPFLTETTVQLESVETASLCLTQKSDDDEAIGLVLSKCNGSNFNQSFYLDKTNAYSGLIQSAGHDTSRKCLQMLGKVLHFEDKIFMQSRCTDNWEVLETGALRNVKHGKCLGRMADSFDIIPVDCNTDLVETWRANDNRHDLFHISFETKTKVIGSTISPESSGPFEIEGYGVVPNECHDVSGARCDIEIYGYTMNSLILVAKTSDAWEFTIRGDIGELISYETELGGLHISSFPTLLGLGSFDRQQTYALTVRSQCFDVVFTTIGPTQGGENEDYSFIIDGYGPLSTACHSNRGAECSIIICGRKTLVLKAYTMDTWQFSLSGDVGKLRQYRTVPGGVHEELPTMDVLKHDFLHVYDLQKRTSVQSTSPLQEATSKDEGKHEKDANLAKASKTISSSSPLSSRPNIDGSASSLLTEKQYVQFRSRRNTSLCLNFSEQTFNNDVVNIFYSNCDSQNRFFITLKEKSKENSQTSFALRSSNNECIVTKVLYEETFTPSLSNVALHKPTIQSTTFGTAVSSKAVNGDRIGTFYDGSITHTTVSTDPYWTVHLQSPYLIERILVFNRDDPCCRSRLNDFKLAILRDKLEVWSYIHTGEANYKTTIIPTMHGVIGDEVKIMLFGTERVLSLAQVEVYSRLSQTSSEYSQKALQTCSESWEMLENGAMKNVNTSQCLGRESDSSLPILVDCDSQLTETWTHGDDENKSFKVHFKTNSKESTTQQLEEASSSGPFEIEGYGSLPPNCYNTTGAECEIEFHGMTSLSINAKTSDSWEFTLSGDVGPLLSFETATGGTHKSPFPTIMGLGGYDTRQRYVLTKSLHSNVS